ncbi:replicative DNA helicase [Paenibacillus mucilaginosus 3016]|uniref:DNA 5'-3' helicase n=1 Tax=Paenibacillus mucilaginosus 3016 TaxID=1116391 RepID=H6NGS9_9BACL|nr:DnaB-like helicase C-terminal domain-containing protein [Paenibacillus mucilaginosus]AFC28371.1 replicative DNA helicase [Paenibacillus mucilaginosus 3016]WFA17173.1 helicase [Paenibacillus mucilaginosus]
MLQTEALEMVILGSVFEDPSLAREVMATVTIDMFRQPWNRNLYRMMAWLEKNNHPVNYTNISTYFAKDMGKIGGVDYLLKVIGSVVSVSEIRENMKLLAELDARRKLSQLIEQTRALIDDPAAGRFDEILDTFEQKALEIRPKVSQENKSGDRIRMWFENLLLRKQNPSLAFGVLTGWDPLDRMTLGFQRSNLIVIGARTSMGKSAFANEIKVRASSMGNKVADFSLEMTIEQIYNRMASTMCGIPLQAIRIGNLTDFQIGLIADKLDEFAKIPIDDSRGVTTEYITSEMRRMKRQEGLDLVVVDYLQEINETAEQNDNGGSALHRVCQKLRAAAKDCDCAVIGLSQVKQDVDSRANKRPMVSDLSGSAAIAAVADDILLLYRDEYYNPETSDKGILEVNVAKQRNGPTGIVKLKYDKDTQKITV